MEGKTGEGKILKGLGGLKRGVGLPADEMASCFAQGNVIGEVEGFAPVDDFTVRIVRVFGAEGRPADQAFEHDGAYRPPIAAERVAFASEDLGCNVVGRPDCGIRHDAARFAPGVDLVAIADGEVDLIDVDGVAVIFGFRGGTFQ